MCSEVYDFVIIGSGFGGSVCAMRLSEKGYRVLLLERGKRFDDQDFARTTWSIRKFLWLPILRCFGILQMNLLRGLFVFGSSGVGGGSLVYAGVLMEPDDSFFNATTWSALADWKTILRPHYNAARRMLGVTPNPRLTSADHALHEIATEMNRADFFRRTEVGIYFGEEGKETSDPYFGGDGPPRVGCIHCGGCMVGCRNNSKNTLPKNYLYFAEKWGSRVIADAEAHDIRPLAPNQPDLARYEVHYRSVTSWLFKTERRVRGRHVILSAGVLGTNALLLRCRDVTRSLPNLSPHLGEKVRTNSEAFLAAFSRTGKADHSKGLAITSVFQADNTTKIEPIRFSDRSSLVFRLLSAPFIEGGGGLLDRVWNMCLWIVQNPLEFIDLKLIPGLTRRGTALMIMQTNDNEIRLSLKRNLLTLFRFRLMANQDPGRGIPVSIALGNQIIRLFAKRIGGYPVGGIPQGLLNAPMTAHLVGGCIFGQNASQGVIDFDFQVFNYPGLFIVDGSVVPANPGINPSLTITALAEFAMSRIAPKEGATPHQPHP